MRGSLSSQNLITGRLVVVCSAVALAGCGAAPSHGSPTAFPSASSVTATTTTTVTTTNAAPSVTSTSSVQAGLRGYLAEVERADARLRAAAALVNADVVGDGMRIRPATRTAISALDLAAVARALPTGAGEALTRKALLVYSELSSRRAALHGLVQRTPPREGIVTLAPGSEALSRVRECLTNGNRAAARFGPDLLALRALAATSRPLTAPEPDSHAVAEAAVRARYIDGWNGCCDACGGYVTDRLVPIVWRAHDDPVEGHTDGTVDGVAFEASYRHGVGWTVVVHAG